jgi:hypothetical protein
MCGQNKGLSESNTQLRAAGVQSHLSWLDAAIKK